MRVVFKLVLIVIINFFFASVFGQTSNNIFGSNSLTMYGVIGDGLHDDTQALQQLILSGVGNQVFIPAGVYLVTKSINIPSETTIIFSKGTKIISNTDETIFIHVKDVTNSNITISGCVIEGNINGNKQYAIAFKGVKNVLIEKNTISNTARGIRLDDCTDFVIINNIFNNNGYTKNEPDRSTIFVNLGSDGRIIFNNIYDGIGSGINVLAVDNLEISSNKIWRCSVIGIIAAGTTHKQMIISKNNCCYNGVLPISSHAAGGINTHGLSNGVITQNICCYNNNFGIDVNGDNAPDQTQNRSMGLIITENIVTNNANNGIVVFQAKNVTVSNNICRENFKNIVVSGVNSSYIDIINNKCYDSKDSPNIWINQGTLIFVDGNVCGEIFFTKGIIEFRVDGGTKINYGYNDFSAAIKKDAVVLTNKDNIIFKNKNIYISDEITLSGEGEKFTVPMIINKDNYSSFVKAYIIYTAPTSADTGIECGIGSYGKTDTYWGGQRTLSNAMPGMIQIIDLNNNGQVKPNDSAPYFYCKGSKKGYGKIRIVLEYVPDLPLYY